MTDLTQGDEFWAKLEAFDTGSDSLLRDANVHLWAALRGAEMIRCIPWTAFKEDASLQSWVWLYARQVAHSVAALFNPDGTIKESK